MNNPRPLSAYTEEQFADMAKWPNGWNGEGSLAPLPKTLANMRAALNASTIRDDDHELMGNENGTVTLERDTKRGLLMVEVGIKTYAHLHLVTDGPAEMWNGPIEELTERGVQTD